MSVIKTGYKYPLLDLKTNNSKYSDLFLSYFKEYIKNGHYILGPYVESFEKKMAAYIDKKYCVGVGNGTNALEIAFQALRIDENDEVLIQGNTYIVTAFALKKRNPKIIPVDVTPEGVVNVDDLERKITEKTKLIVLVHLYGDCCNVERVRKLCDENNIYLVEDCAQAQGTKYNGKMIGSFADISCFSFYPSKNLGAIGDGGAICTDNDELYNKMKKIRNIGSTIKYVHDELGTNSRLNPCMARILEFKLGLLDEEIIKKREIICWYKKYLNPQLFELVKNPNEKVYHSYHLCVVKSKIDNFDRKEFIKYCERNGIEILVHYPNLFYQNSIFEDLVGLSYKGCEDFNSTIFSVPLYSTLMKENIKEITYIINNFKS